MSVSVILPNYNGAALLQKHLPNVMLACAPDDEIIVVDDASTDESLKVLASFFPKVKVIKLKENQRFAGACNEGVKQASHEIVVLLNTDVSPQKTTFRNLEACFQNQAEVFAVGCSEKANHLISGRSCARFARGMFIHARHPNQESGFSAWASGGSMAVRRSYWNKLGGMDTLFRPAYYEDIDLSYRAWKNGWKVLFCESAKVDHHHESTNKAIFGRWKMEVMSHKNSFLFFWKNVSDLRLWTSHCFWLPYHILVGGVRTRGALPLGFFRALLQLPELLSFQRVRMKRVLTDKEIEQMIGCV